MFQTQFVEKFKTHILCSVNFSQIALFMRYVGKKLYSRAGPRWQYGACALHAGYLRLKIHTVKLCNTCCFSTATMVARTRLNSTLYVICLYCWILLWFPNHATFYHISPFHAVNVTVLGWITSWCHSLPSLSIPQWLLSNNYYIFMV
jgi:hypothetical protein